MPANYGGSITDFRRLSGAPIAMVSRVNEIDELIRKKKEEEKKKNSPATDDILVVESEGGKKWMRTNYVSARHLPKIIPSLITNCISPACTYFPHSFTNQSLVRAVRPQITTIS